MPLNKGTIDARGIFFFQAEDGIRDDLVTGVQTCALPIYPAKAHSSHFGTAGRLSTKLPVHDSRSIRTPIPTITRNAQNTGATGGVSSNSSRDRKSVG